MKFNFYLFILFFSFHISFLKSQETMKNDDLDSTEKEDIEEKGEVGEKEDIEEKGEVGEKEDIEEKGEVEEKEEKTNENKPIEKEQYYEEIFFHPYDKEILKNKVNGIEDLQKKNISSFFIAKINFQNLVKSISYYTFQKDPKGNTSIKQNPYLNFNETPSFFFEYEYNASNQLVKRKFMNESGKIIEYNQFFYENENSKDPISVEIYKLNSLTKKFKKYMVLKLNWKKEILEYLEIYNSELQLIEKYNFINLDKKSSIQIFSSTSNFTKVGNFSIPISYLKKYSRYYMGKISFYIVYIKKEGSFMLKRYNKNDVMIQSKIIPFKKVTSISEEKKEEDKEFIEKKSSDDITSSNEESKNEESSLEK